MTDHELRLLRYAADDELLFHTGSWGGPAGYRWQGPDGGEAGQVPPWDEPVLDRLADRGLITVEARRGPLDRRVMLSQAGAAAVATLTAAA